MGPPNLHVELTSDNHVTCTWSEMTNNIELLNGWYLSGYVVKVTEHSVPFVPFTAVSQYEVTTTTLEQSFGPLAAGREYKLSVAGQVENRTGVFADVCIRTREKGKDVIKNFTRYFLTIQTYFKIQCHSFYSIISFTFEFQLPNNPAKNLQKSRKS